MPPSTRTGGLHYESIMTPVEIPPHPVPLPRERETLHPASRRGPRYGKARHEPPSTRVPVPERLPRCCAQEMGTGVCRRHRCQFLREFSRWKFRQGCRSGKTTEGQTGPGKRGRPALPCRDQGQKDSLLADFRPERERLNVFISIQH
jgi:hypothetical protein